MMHLNNNNNNYAAGSKTVFNNRQIIFRHADLHHQQEAN